MKKYIKKLYTLALAANKSLQSIKTLKLRCRFGSKDA